MSKFEKELQCLLNKFSKESNSDTPDYILAKYLIICLSAFDSAVKEREVWHGRIK